MAVQDVTLGRNQVKGYIHRDLFALFLKVHVNLQQPQI